MSSMERKRCCFAFFLAIDLILWAPPFFFLAANANTSMLSSSSSSFWYVKTVFPVHQPPWSKAPISSHQQPVRRHHPCMSYECDQMCLPEHCHSNLYRDQSPPTRTNVIPSPCLACFLMLSEIIGAVLMGCGSGLHGAKDTIERMIFLIQLDAFVYTMFTTKVSPKRFGCIYVNHICNRFPSILRSSTTRFKSHLG